MIAVDGGLSYCGILELEPDLLIGDFDSVSEEEKEAIEIIKAQAPEKVIELCPIKDDTDMLAALKLGLEKGYSDFRIYGGTGGRLEHTIANIQCLLFLKEQGNNTLGTFMRKMVRGSLTEEQQKLLDESLQKEIH